MNNILSKSFLWMAIGLLITFATGYVVSVNENMLMNIFGGSGYIIFIAIEFLLVIVLSARVMTMKPAIAKVCFALYSFISGLTFSVIFVVYEMSSIIYIFLITAILFGIMALIGKITSLDLTKVGTYFYIGLFAVIIVSLLNVLVFKSSTLALGISVLVIILFIGITAYDVQKIKRMAEADLPEDNVVICGALSLYLDFINIFIELLRIFGKGRD